MTCPNQAVREGPDHETCSIKINKKGVISRRSKSNPSSEVKEEEEEKLLELLKDGILGSKYNIDEKQNKI
jgi:hypothetical protein